MAEQKKGGEEESARERTDGRTQFLKKSREKIFSRFALSVLIKNINNHQFDFLKQNLYVQVWIVITFF